MLIQAYTERMMDANARRSMLLLISSGWLKGVMAHFQSELIQLEETTAAPCRSCYTKELSQKGIVIWDEN